MTVSIHILDLVYMFLAHLSQRLNLAIVIVICLSFYVINIKEQFFFMPPPPFEEEGHIALHLLVGRSVGMSVGMSVGRPDDVRSRS